VFNEKHATKVTEAETTSDTSETLASPGLYCIVIVHLSIGVKRVTKFNNVIFRQQYVVEIVRLLAARTPPVS